MTENGQNDVSQFERNFDGLRSLWKRRRGLALLKVISYLAHLLALSVLPFLTFIAGCIATSQRSDRDKLAKQLEPFVETASQYFPSEEPEKRLGMLRLELEKVQQRHNEIQRAYSKLWGAKREIRELLKRRIDAEIHCHYWKAKMTGGEDDLVDKGYTKSVDEMLNAIAERN